MKKRMFGILLAVLLCAALAAGASAEGGAPIVGGVTVDGTVEIGGGTAAYDAASNTLTLENVNWTGSGDGIAAKSDLNIVLSGENSFVSANGLGVVYDGALSISGSGSLRAGTEAGSGSCGISGDGDLSISGGAVVEAVSAVDQCLRITGNATVDGAALKGSGTGGGMSIGGTLSVNNGGSVTAEVSAGSAIGADVISVDGGSVSGTAYGGNNGDWGVSARERLTVVNGGTVYGSATSGIWATQLEVSGQGSKVTAQAIEFTQEMSDDMCSSVGLYTEGVTVSGGGVLEAEGAMRGITISNGSLTVTGAGSRVTGRAVGPYLPVVDGQTVRTDFTVINVDGNVTASEGAMVEAFSEIKRYTGGLRVNYGGLNADGTLSVNSGGSVTAEVSAGSAISAKVIAADGGSVSGTSYGVNLEEYGLCAGEISVVNGGTVYGSAPVGVRATQLEVSGQGSKMTAQAAEYTQEMEDNVCPSVGLHSDSVTVSGGGVLEAEGTIDGITISKGSLTITGAGSRVTGTALGKSNSSYATGVTCNGGITVSDGGALEGTAYEKRSTGVSSGEKIEVSGGGSVKGTGDWRGVFVGDRFNRNDGLTVSGAGSSVTGVAQGIYADDVEQKPEEEYGSGVRVLNGDLTVSDGALLEGTGSGESVNGILVGPITVDGQVTGPDIESNVSVSNGATIKGTANGRFGHGLYTNGDVTVDASALESTGDGMATVIEGDTIVTNGGSIDAEGPHGYILQLLGKLTVSGKGSSVSSKSYGHGEIHDSYGISVQGGLNVTDGATVYAEGTSRGLWAFTCGVNISGAGSKVMCVSYEASEGVYLEGMHGGGAAVYGDLSVTDGGVLDVRGARRGIAMGGVLTVSGEGSSVSASASGSRFDEINVTGISFFSSGDGSGSGAVIGEGAELSVSSAEIGVANSSGSPFTVNGGHVTVSGGEGAFGAAPVLSGYAGSYGWRTGENAAFTSSKLGGYVYDAAHTYVEIQPGEFAPAVSGTVRAGETLTINIDGTSYVWQTGTSADGPFEDINGTNRNYYKLKPRDEGLYVRVVVTLADGSTIASEPVGPVAAKHETVVQPSQTVKEPEVAPAENGSVTVAPARPGETATVIPEPDSGYVVDKVIVTDSSGNRIEVEHNPDGTYTFDQPQNIVSVEVTYAQPEVVYTDISSESWYYDDFLFVESNGLMEGSSETEFNPEGTMSRAMIWTVLARADGEAVTGADWYETARLWAVSAGISDGSEIHSSVTREQLAVMLWRFAGMPGAEGGLDGFSDTEKVSSWAEQAMAWAIEAGIINGVDAETLDPYGTATRAQCAAMLTRYMQYMRSAALET